MIYLKLTGLNQTDFKRFIKKNSLKQLKPLNRFSILKIGIQIRYYIIC